MARPWSSARCRRSLPGGRRSQAGQGLVEFAVILPLVALTVFGLLDAGRLVYTNSTLSQAAREGARRAAAEAAWIGLSGSGCVSAPSGISSANPGAHVCPPDVTAFKSDVVDAVAGMAVMLGPIGGVHVSCNEGSASDQPPAGSWTESPGGGNGCSTSDGSTNAAEGRLVSVRVEYTYQPITPIISSIIGSLPLSGSATMVIH